MYLLVFKCIFHFLNIYILYIKKMTISIAEINFCTFKLANIISFSCCNHGNISVASPFFERGFLVNNASMFVMHDVHSINGQSNRYNYRQISRNIETFAVDVKSRTIYFVDSGNSLLKKHNIISQQESTVATISSAKGKWSRIQKSLIQSLITINKSFYCISYK